MNRLDGSADRSDYAGRTALGTAGFCTCSRPVPRMPTARRLLACLTDSCGLALRMHFASRSTSTTDSKSGPTTAGPPRRWRRSGSTPTTSACEPTRDDLSKWWTVFNDPGLDTLICCAYRQNLTLREAGCRVLQARAQLGIATGQTLPAIANDDGRAIRRNAVSRADRQRPVHRGAVLQPVELRLQPQLGTRFLGPVPPGDRIGRRQPGCLGRGLRRRAGHLAGRRGHELRADAHARRADRVRQGQRAIAARDVDDHRSPLPRRHDQRAGRVPGPKHPGANRGPDSRVGDQPPADDQPTVHPAGHAAGRIAGQARSGAHSHGAGRGGRRHPGRLAAPPPGRPPRGASGGRPVRTDRHRRGRLLSGHLDQRHARIFGRSSFPTSSAPRPSTATSALRSSGTS